MTAVSHSSRASSQREVPFTGALLAMAAAFVWSLGALCNRWSDGTDAWQYLLWRSIGIIVGTQVLATVRRERAPLVRAWTSGWLMVTASAALLSASLGFVYALKNTTAANASFFASLSPFVAAFIGFVFMKERFARSTYLAMALAGAGLLMLAYGPSGGSRGDGLAPTLRGNLAGLFCSFGFAGYVICLRRRTTADWSPAMPGYSSIMILLCAVVTIGAGNSLVPDWQDAGFAIFHGAILIVVGTLTFNRATKTVPPVAVTVLAQVETIAVPLLVWIAFSEVPSPAAIFGGLLILSGVVLQAFGQTRSGISAPISAAEAEHGV